MLGDNQDKLQDISNKFRNPYGNSEVINDFAQKLKNEIKAKEDALAQMEELREQGSKKLKPNPPIQEEINMAPVKMNMAPSSSTTIIPIQPTIPKV